MIICLCKMSKSLFGVMVLFPQPEKVISFICMITWVRRFACFGDSGIDEALAYDEFGKQTSGEHGKFSNPFAFTRYQSDPVSGVQFAQNRYYAQDLGRFNGEDPPYARV